MRWEAIQQAKQLSLQHEDTASTPTPTPTTATATATASVGDTSDADSATPQLDVSVADSASTAACESSAGVEMLALHTDSVC